jgi:hypothetical protein
MLEKPWQGAPPQVPLEVSEQKTLGYRYTGFISNSVEQPNLQNHDTYSGQQVTT